MGAQNGVDDYIVVGPNGNSLFLPAAGYRFDSVLYGVGSVNAGYSAVAAMTVCTFYHSPITPLSGCKNMML